MALHWLFGAFSDIGQTRKKNDDSGYAGPHLVVVADGMGGAAAGDLASTVTVQTLQGLDAPPPDDMLDALAGALRLANDRLAELVEEDPTVAGMGTTVTAALFDGQRIAIAHLGDSRGYLWREGELLRLTADHTWVQSLIDEGRITEEEAKVHSHRSLLLKVLDGQHDHEPDLSVYDARPGDRLLLCSDGLSGFVDSGRIERVLSIGTADSVARELTQLALEAGSTDNITVIVADVVDSETVTGDPVVVGAVAAPPRKSLSRRRGLTQREEALTGKSLMADPAVDPEELRYAPREPRRFSGLRRVALLLVLAAVLAAGGFAAYAWSQQQYYVGAYGDRVAIYRGVRADLPGLKLHSVFQAEDLLLSELPSFRRSQVVEGLAADSFDSAHQIVGKLQAFARVCAQQAAASTTPVPRSPVATTSGLPASSGPASTATVSQRPPSTPPQSNAPTPKPSHTRLTAPAHTRSIAPPRRAKTTTSPRPAKSAAGAAAPEECAGATPVTLATHATGTPK
jgi:PPM family protein phosphatase